MRTLLAPLLVSGVAFGVSGCGIVSSEFDGAVTLEAVISSDPDETFFDGCVSFDPNEDEDFQQNKDKLDGGLIRGISIQITDVNFDDTLGTVHEARYGVGQIDVRRNPDPSVEDPTCDDSVGPPFIVAAAEWDPVELRVGESFDLEIDQAVMDEIHELVFEDAAPLEVKFVGIADEQTNFTFDVRFELEFDVRLP